MTAIHKMTDIGNGINFTCYLDDTQLYVILMTHSSKSDVSHHLNKIEDCVRHQTVDAY